MGANAAPGTRSLTGAPSPIRRASPLLAGACGLGIALGEMALRDCWPSGEGLSRWRAVATIAGLYALPAMAAGGLLEALHFRRRRRPAAPAGRAGGAAAVAAALATGLAGAAATQWLILGEAASQAQGAWRAGALTAGAAAALLPLLALRTGRFLAPFVAALALSFLAAGPGGTRAAPAGRPNVLLVVMDTLRPDRLSCYGYDRSTSPRLDALAARGVLFEEAVTHASFTMPAMATLFTGRLPFEHGVRCHPSALAAEDTTLAERFHAAGYRTAAVVSNVLLSRRWGFAQGFDSFDVVAESPFGAAGAMTAARALQRLGRGEPADETAGVAARWLRRHAGSRPFFLWVHFIDPHFPYEPPARLARRFDRADPAAYEALLGRYARGEIARGALAARETLPPAVLAAGSDRYDAEIAFSDEGLGVLLDVLDELGVAGETLVVVTGDHGESLGEHGLNFAHTFTTHETLMKVPLVASGAGVSAKGRRVARQVGLVDLAPTLLAAAGLPAAPSARGEDLGPFLRGEERGEAAPAAYGENAPLLPGHPSHDLIASFEGIHRAGMEGKWRMVREWPWKLIHVPGRPEGEDLLFQLEADPGELDDRAARDPEALAALRQRLRAFQEEEAAAARATVPEVDEEMAARLRSLGYAH